jgi:class 3 adenylate cyclase
MPPAIDREILDARLARLSGLLDADTAALGEHIARAPDRALARINPHELAREIGAGPDETAAMLLAGVRAELFSMEWALLCRGCGEIAGSAVKLEAVEAHFDCQACDARRESSLDQNVQVLFTVRPEIRRLEFHDPAGLELHDFFFEHRFARSILLRDTDTRLVDYLSANRRVMAVLEPGAEERFEVELPEGWLVGSPRAMVTVSPEAAPGPGEIALAFDGAAFTPRPAVRPGRATLRLRNDSPEPVNTLLYHTPIVTYFDYAPALWGRDVLNTPAFRRHLQTEVVRPGTGLPVKDNTILFVDFVGSTARYGEIGDEAAFELVSAHLECLGRLVTRAGGAVVKTIGDAVMASFSRPCAAMATAMAIRSHLDAEIGAARFATRIGAHRGPCIAVNVGDSVDYFGNTVNIASRLEHTAGTDEIFASVEVARDPEVRRLYGDQLGEPEAIEIRGVAGPVMVHRIAA